jgi:hypothetical protein
MIMNPSPLEFLAAFAIVLIFGITAGAVLVWRWMACRAAVRSATSRTSAPSPLVAA